MTNPVTGYDAEEVLRERANTIRQRLRADMTMTLGSLKGTPELVMDALLDDAMHQIEQLLTGPTPTYNTYSPWNGRSLAFIRMVSGRPAYYASAEDAYRQTDLETGPVEVGNFCWYDTSRFGNITLSVGGGMVLGLDHFGWPVVTEFDWPGFGTYLGHSKQIGRT